MEERIINAVIDAGFKVYMRDVNDSWLIFADGKRLGYLQTARFRGISTSTVHIPNRDTGSGFQIDDDIQEVSKKTLERALCHAPRWADGRQRESVKKWDGIEHYRKGSGFASDYKEVTKQNA